MIDETQEMMDDDIIVPEGWDGESDILSSESDELDSPTTDEQETKLNEEEGKPIEDEETQAVDEGTGVEDTGATEVDENVDTELTETVNEQPTVQQPQTIKVKFNHEEKELSLDEAIPLVQKGMNYDRVAPTVDKISQLAKQMGYQSLTDMADQLATKLVDNKVEELIDTEGISEELARRIVNQEMALEAQRVKEAQAAAEVEELNRAQAEIELRQQMEVQAFVTAFPGVTVIPEEVKVLHSQGMPLVAAYAKYEVQKAKSETVTAEKEKQKIKQNQEAASRAPVGGVTKHGATDTRAADPFEDGFDSDSW